tara:strand:- start:1321 stop:1482 length:162 start_codon:yes stop_codon:yes gene_type:complete
MEYQALVTNKHVEIIAWLVDDAQHLSSITTIDSPPAIDRDDVPVFDHAELGVQ